MSANNAERGKSKPQVLQSQQKSKPDLLNLPISTQGFPWAISSLSPLRYPHSKSQVQGIRPELHLAWDLVWQTLLTMLHPRSSLYIIIHIYIYIYTFIYIYIYIYDYIWSWNHLHLKHHPNCTNSTIPCNRRFAHLCSGDRLNHLNLFGISASASLSF